MTTPDFSRTVYYLPGHGGHLHTGLGEGLLSRGWQVTGRATVGDFRHLPFAEQVAAVAEDLQAHFWHQRAHVVANSFGAYQFLHAQAQMAPFPGKVLMFSPIVGGFSSETTAHHFMPPRSDRLRERVEAGTFPVPLQCQIHVGADGVTTMIAQTWPWAGSHQCSGWPWPLEVSTSSSLAKWGDYRVIQPEQPTDPIQDVEIEAVFSKATQIIAWRELQNDSVWRQGWV